jgi:superfamily II DNA or RNA helicase
MSLPTSVLTPDYSAGTLVRARGREWVVLPGSNPAALRLRPLSGAEHETAVIDPVLEARHDPVVTATFPLPDAGRAASPEEAQLLRDALLMSLRRGAGPFRSFGHLAFEPRAYQLVPLLMALRQDTVRLLVADDVGIGKTIEAGMIARELLDRGEVRRLAVLCPPHLVDQWIQELADRFHLPAVAVTAASAARLERSLPVTESIFSVHPYTVVSLDYIKSDRRRGDFAHRCPELVIVDEAHTCAGQGAGRHQRHDLLRLLAGDLQRHMVLLTATPHSGDESSFHNLLGLVDPVFLDLAQASGAERERLRTRLARHFVQRRRQDIQEWNDSGVFPRRQTADLPYAQGGAWRDFLDAVLEYCSDVVGRAGSDERRQRLNFWGTLALMRSAASSPAAALQSLRTRAAADLPVQEEVALLDRVFDGSDDTLPEDDAELPAALSGAGDPELDSLMAQARRLVSSGQDPKLAALRNHLANDLLAEGYAPVVFCRYIATAHYLHDALKAAFPGITVGVVTGELTPDERKLRVAELGDTQRPLLIATDCLSEGINLQQWFTAVVHYDLSWNPTRHEQREGRVDRFGQQARVVRATLMYGQDNQVDLVVLKVILRKAQKIREELGVPVPLPDQDHSLTQALMQAVLSRRRDQRQYALPLEEMPQVQRLEVAWTDLAERARRNRTVFAQQAIRPADVLPEWQRMQAALGQAEDVQRFVQRAMQRLGAPLEPRSTGGWRAPVANLPEDLRERLLAEGLPAQLPLSFTQPPATGSRFIHRSHPLVATLAEGLLERALADAGLPAAASADPALLGRTGCWTTRAVQARTTVLLLRLRLQITEAGADESLLVEEAAAVALHSAAGGTRLDITAGHGPLQWLTEPAAGPVTDATRLRMVQEALGMASQWGSLLQAHAQERAQTLLDDHQRVREAARMGRRRPRVQALLPVDVMGVFVLLPHLEV